MTDHEKHLQTLARIAVYERRIGRSYDETNPDAAAKRHEVADALDYVLERLPLLEATRDAAVRYVSAMGACDNSPCGDPWDGLCEEPGCDYCALARALEAKAKGEP